MELLSLADGFVCQVVWLIVSVPSRSLYAFPILFAWGLCIGSIGVFLQPVCFFVFDKAHGYCFIPCNRGSQYVHQAYTHRLAAAINNTGPCPHVQLLSIQPGSRFSLVDRVVFIQSKWPARSDHPKNFRNEFVTSQTHLDIFATTPRTISSIIHENRSEPQPLAQKLHIFVYDTVVLLVGVSPA